MVSKIIQCMTQEVLLREEILLSVRSSRLLHQESQLKNWRVMEMERIIRSDMRLNNRKNFGRTSFFFFH